MRNAHLDGLLEVTDVEKHNGYEDGDGRYTVEVSYSLEAQEDLEGYTNQVKGNEDLRPGPVRHDHGPERLAGGTR